jgi:prephenate dehydratase/chorismate mutase/prephenate dehydratase
MDLSQIRKQIDGADRELLMLINKRMELVVRAGKLKSDVTDPDREAAVLSRGLVSPEFSAALFKQIIGQAKHLQEERSELVGFQGEHGAFSEIAVRSFNKDAISLPHNSFSDVFDGVNSGILDYGVVPIENSLGGAVTQVDDLLMETDLFVVGEIAMPIHQCLLTLPESDYRDIRVVYSHPQALSQCKGFLARNKLEARPHYDTAGSALMLSRDKPVAAAVIASKLCAELYNLDVVKENIEDENSNTTRFVVLSKTASKAAGEKCTIFFSTAHKPGALLNILKLFSDAGVNLTRIESKPAPKSPGSYAFLVDFMGSITDSKIKSALDAVQKETSQFRLIGCYSLVGQA